MIESRTSGSRSVPLPVDFLKMVREVFATNFDAGLKAVGKLLKDPYIDASGAILNKEVVLAISLHFKKQLAATTVYASSDFDPKASSPTVQDLLGLCVDAAGALFEQLLDPANTKRLQALTSDSLSALEDIPFEWTPYTFSKRTVYLKVDKANPEVDRMTEEWLDKNDPDRKEREAREHEETEKLFVTGPSKKPDSGSGLH